MEFFSKYFTKPKYQLDISVLAEMAPHAASDANRPAYEELKKQGTESLDFGDFEGAVLFFEAAHKVALNSESHLNLGFALLELGHACDAKIHFQQAVKLNPDNFDAHLIGAMAAVADAEYDTAFKSINLALKINPESDAAKTLLYKLFAIKGDFKKIEENLILQNQGVKSASELQILIARTLMNLSLDEAQKQSLLSRAEVHLRLAIELDAAAPHAYIELGNLFLTQNRPEFAIQNFENAIACDVSFTPPHYGLAAAYKTLNNNIQAYASAEKAVLADPKHIDAYRLLAVLCQQKSDQAGAEEFYKKILLLEPDTPDVLVMLSNIYANTKQYQRSIEIARQAVSLRKNSPEAYFALGNALYGQHLFSEAVVCYRRAVKLRPDYFDVRNNLAASLLSIGNNEEALKMYQTIVVDDPKHTIGLQNIAFCLSFDAGCTPPAYLTAVCKFGAIASEIATPFTSWRQKPLHSRPLKVGFVSGDFRQHPVGHFLESVLSNFDIEKIEIHAFSNLTSFDNLQASLKSRVSKWTSIAGISDAVAAQLIHDSELDLLIDLAGHTGAGRCALFAWRPAPVQAAWLGYWASTGVTEIDYVLCDRVSVLQEHHAHFTEKVWYLADARMCFTPPSAVYELVPSLCPAVKQGCITFGCFQPIRKLNKTVFALWSRIYQQLPNARFRLQGEGFTDPNIREELLRRITDAGLSSSCISLHESEPTLNYLKSHREVDIILDTFPFPGGTTTCEALWMGVPTVTLTGVTMLSRQGTSLMTYAGLADWVANTEDEYVAIAIQKAGNVKALSHLRAGLRNQVFESPLYNAPRFASGLEQTFRDIVLHKHPRLGSEQQTS